MSKTGTCVTSASQVGGTRVKRCDFTLFFHREFIIITRGVAMLLSKRNRARRRAANEKNNRKIRDRADLCVYTPVHKLLLESFANKLVKILQPALSHILYTSSAHCAFLTQFDFSFLHATRDASRSDSRAIYRFTAMRGMHCVLM